CHQTRLTAFCWAQELSSCRTVTISANSLRRTEESLSATASDPSSRQSRGSSRPVRTKLPATWPRSSGPRRRNGRASARRSTSYSPPLQTIGLS
ncbi:unnamed protein product, partial [Ectocarpus fasciculatus]